MTYKNLILIFLSVIIYSCSLEIEKEKDNDNKKETTNNPLYGDWILINAESESDIYQRPRGFSLSADTLEYYRGLYFRKIDSLTGKRSFIYYGNFTSYKIEKDFIYIDSSLNNLLGFPWKIKKNTNDSLIIVKSNSRIYKFIHPKYNLNEIPPFDKVIFSSYGCYWSCPVIDISMDNQGKVLFRGGRFIEQLGFYTGQLDDKTKEYIFNKFNKANILALNNKYRASATDQEGVIITFIKNEKIIKTISDYGEAAPRELFWACVPLRNLHITNKFDSISNNERFHLDLYFFAFENNGLVLPLKKSESYFLQTELRKSKIIDTIYKSKFEISFREIYFFLEPDLNKNKKHQDEVTGIKTDGRFYTINFKNKKPIIFDLGYNFIERNYNEEEFIKPTEGYRW